MNIEKIKRNRERRIKLNELYYKMVSPISKCLDYVADKKYEHKKIKAKNLTNEEVINIVVKGIIRKIKRTGMYDEEIVVCSRFNDHSYRELGIYNFIGFTNQYWSKNDVVKIWLWDNKCNDIDKIQELANLLVENLKGKIENIKVERVKEEHYCKSWVCENYKETIRISI